MISCTSFSTDNESPAGYDLNAPQTYVLSEELLEISGLAFHRDMQESLWGVADELGIIYGIYLGDKKTTPIKFGPKGDYEDIAIYQDKVFVLRSDGVLFVSSFLPNEKMELQEVKSYTDLLPKGEYESLYVNEKEQLFVLCKKCKQEDKDAVEGHVLQMKYENLAYAESFAIDLREFYAWSDQKKRFRPSGLAQHKLTRDWYILSSVNNTLLITDSTWSIKNAYFLHPSLFGQPEGIGFDLDHNLYISNEGDDGVSPNILRFDFNQTNH
ncbi:hypothetical protein [Catalinimonas niigatensis]|uniref:hypothetical protein n=1 Tax=Catalinimonas niigatensis TaxID=1397264 RepID=UPI0026666EE2|nr:hypothetical protein [Catalinimonas niigatensis]WPP50749.1 hypothetical protein PZB72_29220 [Catalinimonas niigatensis]